MSPLAVLLKICNGLNCQLNDIMETVEETDSENTEESKEENS